LGKVPVNVNTVVYFTKHVNKLENNMETAYLQDDLSDNTKGT